MISFSQNYAHTQNIHTYIQSHCNTSSFLWRWIAPDDKSSFSWLPTPKGILELCRRSIHEGYSITSGILFTYTLWATHTRTGRDISWQRMKRNRTTLVCEENLNKVCLVSELYTIATYQWTAVLPPQRVARISFTFKILCLWPNAATPIIRRSSLVMSTITSIVISFS